MKLKSEDNIMCKQVNLEQVILTVLLKRKKNSLTILDLARLNVKLLKRSNYSLEINYGMNTIHDMIKQKDSLVNYTDGSFSLVSVPKEKLIERLQLYNRVFGNEICVILNHIS